MLSKRRNKPAATKFFARALKVNGLPSKIVIDRSGANTAGINAVNRMLKSFVSASATLKRIEVAKIIRKGQMTPGLCPFAQFASLAA